ncbi:MAG: DUF2281 domain-containing protein [Cytophagales bacterium]|nr:MAG: DUF2281 domain-containing protein [Cytophagales bacterium]
MDTEQLILQQTASLPEELKKAILLYVTFVVQQYQKSATIEEPIKKKRGGLGLYQGMIVMSDDFDEPLDELKEYMQMNRYLLDTHTILWYLENNNRLPQKIKVLLENADNQLFVSIISFFFVYIFLYFFKNRIKQFYFYAN